MKRLSRTVALAGLAVALTAGGIVTSFAQSKEEAVKQRQAVMKQNGKHAKLIEGYVKKGKGSLAAVESAAEKIAAVAPKIPTLFPAGTDEASGIHKTRAKAAIWAKPDDFRKHAAKLETDAKAVAAAARAGDKTQLASAVKAMGGDCGACHKAFRGPKKKK